MKLREIFRSEDNNKPKTSEYNKKYEFTDESITVKIGGETHTLYRIRAIKDIIDESGKVICKKRRFGRLHRERKQS